jgi:leucyl-tRNA synthetase
MIQGRSNFVYRVKGKNQYVSAGLKDQYDTIALNVDVNMVNNDVLDFDAFKSSSNLVFENASSAEFILENEKYICGWEIEKMSKSKWNVVNPDQICNDYGADTLRMYEMFLGPVEQSKPWNTQGIEGVHKFLRKLWRTCIDAQDNLQLTEEEPTAKELKILHKTIKKIGEDIESLSLNTSISAFMICMNELSDLQCKKRVIYEPLLIILSPYAPHICEELWSRLGHSSSIAHASFPIFEEKYLIENTFSYPVSFNGKVRFNIELPLGIPNEEIEKSALSHELADRWLEGKTPKKVIVVPGRIVNVVV